MPYCCTRPATAAGGTAPESASFLSIRSLVASSELPNVHWMAVDVRRPLERLPRLLRVVPVRVPHGERRPALHPFLHVVRARRDQRRVHALGDVRQADRDRGEELHRHPREEVRRDLRQLHGQGVALRRRRRRPWCALPSSTALAPTMSSMNEAAGDCIFGIEGPVERLGEVRRGHVRAVRELEAGLDPEGVGLAVLRRPSADRRRPRGAGGCPPRLPCPGSRAGGARSCCPLPRVAEVRELRIDVVEVRARVVPERPAPSLGLAAGGGSAAGGTGKRRRYQEADPDCRERGREPESVLHVTPFEDPAGTPQYVPTRDAFAISPRFDGARAE